MQRLVPFALAPAVLLSGPRAVADTRANAPAGGGLPALEVKVDLGALAVQANGASVPIALERPQLPGDEAVVVEPVAIGLGRRVVHVRIPAKDGPAGVAWEAIFAPGQPHALFAGLTGLTQGDPGERTGKVLQIISNGPTSFVLLGDIREDLSICGQASTPMDPLALYPGSLAFRPATVQRLSEESRASAQKVEAKDNGPKLSEPLARLLVARGSSVPDSTGAELTDGDVQTVWREKRPGAGQGEFVVMAAPKDVPTARMQIVIAPPGPKAAHPAAPQTFYIVTNAQAFEVTLPNNAWAKPGESYEIKFPQPIESSCVSVVLDSAQPPDLAHPDVGIAELVAYSEFDAPDATLLDVAKMLSSNHGVAAAQVLERAGDGALAAVDKAYDDLDPRGRALAIDVAAAHALCEEAAPLLARALCDNGGEAPRKAREKLERCKGAAPMLAKRLREDAPTRACVASTLAALSPREAIEPIADVIGATPEADGKTREALRAAFSQTLKAAPQGTLAAIIGDAKRSAVTRLEIMRAAEARVTEAPAESEATLSELLRGAPPMRTRYLALGPLEELARAGQHTAAVRVIDALAHDPDWPVRARAAVASAGIPDAQALLVAAARDPAPRVREAALQALAASPSPGAVRAARAILSEDGWSFVKAQAVGVLANAPPARDVDEALGGALYDRSVSVRGSALLALGHHRAGAYRDAIRERLDDADEDVEVRAAAATALGEVCDLRSTDRLTELARGLAIPGSDEQLQQVALGALAGLAVLQPHDLKGRLAPLLAPAAPPFVRSAAQQAILVRGSCR